MVLNTDALPGVASMLIAYSRPDKAPHVLDEDIIYNGTVEEYTPIHDLQNVKAPLIVRVRHINYTPYDLISYNASDRVQPTVYELLAF